MAAGGEGSGDGGVVGILCAQSEKLEQQCCSFNIDAHCGCAAPEAGRGFLVAQQRSLDVCRPVRRLSSRSPTCQCV